VTDRLLRTRDVATLLDVSCETVLRWHRSGKLPGGQGPRMGPCVIEARTLGVVGRMRSALEPAPLSPRSGAFALREAPMPAEARGHVRKLPSGKWQLRYYDPKGVRHSGGAFPTRSEAWSHYRDAVEPELSGRVCPRRDVTLTELVDTFLERHGKVAKPATIETLRWRLRRPLDDYGDIPLADLENMTDELAAFASRLPERFRYSVMSALRQACEAGVRYGYVTRNPAKLAGSNPMPPPRAVRVYTPKELAKIAKELDRRGAAAITLAAATGLRPAEWAHLERRDVDRTRRVLTVRGTKTQRSRREVPLTSAALQALDSLPARLDSPYVFGGARGGPFDLANFRRREWGPSIESAGIAKPARMYDLRSTFASNALAAGITVYELARIMGTSVSMIEAHYGALLDTAHTGLLDRLESFGHLRGTNRKPRTPDLGSNARADDGTRTHDTWLGKPVLYQLSYVREA
jgi:integrase